MEDSCIYISDDEEVADVSVQVLAEVKPKVIDLTGANKSVLDDAKPTVGPDLGSESDDAESNSNLDGPLFEDVTPRNSQPERPPSDDDESLFGSESEAETSVPSQPTPRKEVKKSPPKARNNSQPKVDKIQRRLEKEQIRQQKQREKDLERKQKEVNRANTASKAYQNCTAIVDKAILTLIEDHDEANFRTLFEESSTNYKITCFPKYDHCVTWEFKRAELEDGSCVERVRDTDLILRVMEGSEYVRRISTFRDDPEDSESLNNYIGQLQRKSQAKIVILVHKLGDYLRKEKQKEARKFRSKFTNRFNPASEEMRSSTSGNDECTNESELEELRLMLQIYIEYNNPDWKVHIEFREKTVDVVSAIVKYTRSTASHEIKKKEKAITTLDWAINMDKDKAIDPTRDNGELTRLWIAQLQQFSSVTLPIAKTIALEYPSPSALLDQYTALTHDEAQDLLAPLHVQRNLKRQIGQSISRRIYRFMTSTDPDLHIGYD